MSVEYNEGDIKYVCDEAFRVVKNMHNKPESINSDILLNIYGLYKQIIVGDVEYECDFKTLKEKRKWQYWDKYKGMTKRDAMDELINIINDLVDKWCN
jgi:acyl-CoA-binding protein